MKRPPSRTSTAKSNVEKVVRVKGKPEPKARPIKKVKPTKQVIRREAKRLSIHERNARSNVTKLNLPGYFGRRVLALVFACLALLVVLVLVAVFSPILAVKQIEVVGANRVPVASITKDLQPFIGKPLPQISSDQVAQRLTKYQLIDSVSVVSVPPSKLRVVVVERSAIAEVVINGISYLYDPAGIQLGRAATADQFPVVQDAGNPATSQTFAQAVAVLLKLPIYLLPQVASIKASSKDNVVLQLASHGQKILWGDDSEPALKAGVLKALMKNYPTTFGLTFDVSSPGQPSVY